MKKTVSAILFLLLSIGLFTLAFDIKPALAQAETVYIIVYIKSDGSVSPSSAPISSIDNVTYTFTGNMSYPVYNGVVVERNNIVINGNGYTVQGNNSHSGKGLSLTDISNVTIENANIQDFYYGIYIDSSSNTTVTENNATTSGDIGIYLLYSPNCIVSGNNATANNNIGIVLLRSSNNTVSGNNASENAGNGIRLYYSSNNNTVSMNNVTANSGEGIFLFESSNNNTVSMNNVTANSNGINLDSSSNNTVSGNNVTANYDGGIAIYSSSNNNTVSGNNATANGYDGISVDSSSNNIVSGNTATRNLNDGIDFDSSSNNTVSGNTATANNYTGISLEFSSNNNTVSGNNVTANSEGIYLGDSSNNTIYHNNFIGNFAQTSVDSASVGNAWDDGYPSGGNYWSDYNGTDLKSGPYQNVTGSDAIGDTPYVIDANNTDSYPLMGVYYEFFPGFFSNSTVSVIVISNSTVSDLTYIIWLSTPYDGFQPGQPQIGFLSSGQNGSTSFCRIMIPKIIFSNSSSYTAYVDSHLVNATELPISNNTYVYLYFTYTQPTQQIIVTIPEFSSLILPLFMVATLLAIAIHKKRQLNP